MARSVPPEIAVPARIQFCATNGVLDIHVTRVAVIHEGQIVGRSQSN
jgi:hypothetical protein